MIVLGAALTVALTIGDMNPGFAGIVIAQSLQLTGMFQFSVRMSTEVRRGDVCWLCITVWLPHTHMHIDGNPGPGGELHDVCGASGGLWRYSHGGCTSERHISRFEEVPMASTR